MLPLYQIAVVGLLFVVQEFDVPHQVNQFHIINWLLLLLQIEFYYGIHRIQLHLH